MLVGLALGVAAGVAFLIALNALLAAREPPLLIESLTQAADYLRTDLLGFEHAGEGVVGSDGRAAVLMARDGGSCGLLFVRGDRFVARRVTPGQLRAVEVREPLQLELRLDEVTTPRVHLRFADAADCEAWRRRLSRFAISWPHA